MMRFRLPPLPMDGAFVQPEVLKPLHRNRMVGAHGTGVVEFRLPPKAQRGRSIVNVRGNMLRLGRDLAF